MTERNVWAELAAPFPDSEVKQRPGRGNLTFSYVDARAVMQRLDDVLTPGGWDFTSSVIPGTDVVHGVLTIGGVVREDYGYPNSDHDEEPIKAASSDALKRCAVMFGVGRHLYTDNTASGGRAAPHPARPLARPTVVRDETPEEPADLFADREEFAPIGSASPEHGARPGDVCSEHNEPWRGEVGDLYHGPKPYHRHPDNVRKARRA